MSESFMNNKDVNITFIYFTLFIKLEADLLQWILTMINLITVQYIASKLLERQFDQN